METWKAEMWFRGVTVLKSWSEAAETNSFHIKKTNPKGLS